MMNKEVNIIPKVPMFYRKYSGKKARALVVLQEGKLFFAYHYGRTGVGGGGFHGSKGTHTWKTLQIDKEIVSRDPGLYSNKCFKRWLLRVLSELQTVDLWTGEKSLEIPLTHLSPEGIEDPIVVRLKIHQELSNGKTWTEWSEDWIATQISRNFLASGSSYNLSKISPEYYLFPVGYSEEERDITYLATDEDKIKYAEVISRECLQRPTYPVRKMLKKHGIGK